MTDARSESTVVRGGAETDDDRSAAGVPTEGGVPGGEAGRGPDDALGGVVGGVPGVPGGSPETEAETEVAVRERKAARRELTAAVLLALVGAAIVLSVAGRTWAEGTAPVHGSHIAVAASGNSINKAVSAFALLGLAGALAVLATRTIGRAVVGALVLLAGIGVTVLAVQGASDTTALDSEAASKAAVEGVRAVDVTHAIWPWFAAVGGVLILLAGLFVLIRGRRWPGMSNRYEAPAGQAAAVKRGPSTNADLWNALDRGEDPTR
ncbi:TIGR02234 family membrane protein [Embleya sp. AB8]|uniref:TIGR02234 family membrane protein n=1 Tax=Embleya sp. AB8 TaxID=3156304 RepID=UPI003C737506